MAPKSKSAAVGDPQPGPSRRRGVPKVPADSEDDEDGLPSSQSSVRVVIPRAPRAMLEAYQRGDRHETPSSARDDDPDYQATSSPGVKDPQRRTQPVRATANRTPLITNDIMEKIQEAQKQLDKAGGPLGQDDNSKDVGGDQNEESMPVKGNADDARAILRDLKGPDVNPLIKVVIAKAKRRGLANRFDSAVSMIVLQWIMASTPPNVLEAAIEGDLSARYHAGGSRNAQICVYLDGATKRFQPLADKSHRKPAIYVNYFADRKGASPSPNALRKILNLMEKGLDMYTQVRKAGNDAAPDTSPDSDTKDAYEYLWRATKDRDQNLPMKRIKEHRLFIRALRKRLDHLDADEWDHPLKAPLSEVGYSDNPIKRLDDHVKMNSSNYIMNFMRLCSRNIFDDRFDIVDNQYIVHEAIQLHFVSWAEVFFTYICQAISDNGGGFGHQEAGESVGSAYEHTDEQYEKYVDFAYQHLNLQTNVDNTISAHRQRAERIRQASRAVQAENGRMRERIAHIRTYEARRVKAIDLMRMKATPMMKRVHGDFFDLCAAIQALFKAFPDDMRRNDDGTIQVGMWYVDDEYNGCRIAEDAEQRSIELEIARAAKIRDGFAETRDDLAESSGQGRAGSTEGEHTGAMVSSSSDSMEDDHEEALRQARAGKKKAV